jgi:hypothetical protein
VRVYSEVGTELLLDNNAWSRPNMANYLVTGLTQQKHSFDSGPDPVSLGMERVVEISTTAPYPFSFPKPILTEGQRSET